MFSGQSWYTILHDDGGDGDVGIVGGLRPSWYNILHNDGRDGDVGIVGRLRAFVA